MEILLKNLWIIKSKWGFLKNPNCYQVITNIQPCLFSQDILDERGERLSQESHELTSKGIWPFPESNHETFNKIRQKMKEVHFEAKTKKMQDRISAPGHTFWLNQELGLKRVAASAAVGKIEFYHIPFKNCKLNCKICTNISFASSPISQTLFLAQFVLALWEEILQFKVHACKSGTNLWLLSKYTWYQVIRNRTESKYQYQVEKHVLGHI